MIEKTHIPRVGGSSKNERHAFWNSMVNKYLNSSLARREFCEQNGLSLNEFRGWYYRLQNKSLANKKIDTVKPSMQNTSGFVAVTIEENKFKPRQFAPIYLELPNQLRIQLFNDFNPQTLRTLLQALGVKLC